MRVLLTAVLIIVSGFLYAPSAEEQATPARPTNTLDALVTVIKDDKLRGDFIREIEQARSAQGEQPASQSAESTSAEAAASKQGLMKAVVEWVRDLGARLPSAALGTPIDVKVRQAETQIGQRLSAPDAADQLKSFGLRSLPGWLIGTVAALLVLILVRRKATTRIRKTDAMSKVAKAAVLRAVLGFLPLLACFALAAAWARLLGFSQTGGLIFFVLTVPFAVAIAVSELVCSLLLFLAPAKGGRMVSYAQKRLAPLIGIMTGVAAASSLMAIPELRIAIGPATADILSLILDLAVPLIALYIVLSQRRTVRTLIVRGHAPDDDSSALDRATYWIGSHWHHLGILFVVLNVGARLFGAETGDFITQSFLSVALIVLAFVAAAALRRFGDRRGARAGIRRQTGIRFAIFERLGAMLFRIVKVAIVVIAIAACLELWGVQVTGWAGSTVGAAVLGPLFSIAIVTLTAWTLWVVLDAWISEVLSPSNAANARERSARAKTLLPLLRNVAFVALTVMTVIGALSNLGINVAPLIAGAGVVGLAVGFGLQQLVQDVITGLFILLEDTLAIGDVIDTGDRSGTVEALTIRTVKIRDGDGALHSIPFSMIKALKNSSRGFGVYTASVTLDVDADVERAIEVFKTVGYEVSADPRYASMIRAPLEVWGVDQVGLDGIVIKASIKTLPLQQYGVGREINRRVKESLQAAGIRLATRMSMIATPAAA
jgi:moderate conductance mechanosensitive channel